MPSLEERFEALRAAMHTCMASDSAELLRRLEHLWPPRNHAAVDRKLADLEFAVQRSQARRKEREASIPPLRFPEELPVSQRAEEIIAAIRKHPVLVIAGETGSGKTTQLPKMCLAAGLGVRGKIACTQPRRVAALSVSRRVAEELNVQWGREVGAKIRFTDETSSETLMKFLTDGMLLSELQGDPDMLEYDAVIIDEAHERSLNIDFLLGHLNVLRKRRPDLKIIITSATIDVGAFSKAFGDAPVLEVSGRTYPVEVRYEPIDSRLEDSGDMTYIEAAANACEEIITGNRPGDILVFVPGERDIRELCDLLDGKRLGGAEIMPLFGRLSSGDQQRIFQPTQRRKIVVATNIAETSITVPGIRYVVDTGLARISRYSPQTRTQRLPVEPISQSSADQRKGRCGRVAEGVCIRLYSEQDYLSRPRYTDPEIRRANLAAVILRMLAFNLGQIETFPFIDPPQERAIRSGYALLQELGALDEENNLTPVGRRLARLPVDPTVARMLLQAMREGSLNEVLVIAAGLSIQDPRERPSEARDAADQMHKRFNDPRSDFLSLLNIWKAYHDETERLSQSQLRKFCKAHYLSYPRMREWRDIHAQLTRTLKEMGEYYEAKGEAEYHTIHRALLSGLLGNVAQREEGNHYKATHNRHAMLFPGSALFDKDARKAERKKFKGKEKPSTVSGSRTPPWVVCAEWVETTRLYGRSCASIEQAWILDLGRHILKSSYDAGRWDEKGQRVVCTQKFFLYGLEVARKRVGYSRINPQEATEIFVRSGLVEGGVTEQLPFLEHNRQLRADVEERHTRLRKPSSWGMDDRLYAFYLDRLPPGIGSVPDLRKLIRERGDDSFLRLTEQDLAGELEDDLASFPNAVQIGGESLPLTYAYKPGEEDDGATLTVPIGQFDAIQPGMLDWVVPGYIEQRVEALLRGLPKQHRKALFPIAEKTLQILARLNPEPRRLVEQLTEILQRDFGVIVRRDEWPEEDLPAHLRPRVQVVDDNQEVIAHGRDWQRLREDYKQRVRERQEQALGPQDELGIWKQARQQWEKPALTSWNFDDPPDKIELARVAGVPMEAWPGLMASKEGDVSLRLFKKRSEAEIATRRGLAILGERAVGRDMAWLEKDMRGEFARVAPYAATMGDARQMRDEAFQAIRRHLFRVDQALPLQRAKLEAIVERARKEMRGLPQRFVDLLEEIFTLRNQIVLHKAPFAGMQAELEALLPPEFLRITSLEQLQDFPRYLKTMLYRAERARNAPQKHAQQIARVRPYAEALQKFYSQPKLSTTQLSELERLHWMVEEFKVSVFAQHLGAKRAISEKRLDEQIEKIEGMA